jgi:hypothetical protein
MILLQTGRILRPLGRRCRRMPIICQFVNHTVPFRVQYFIFYSHNLFYLHNIVYKKDGYIHSAYPGQS